MNRRAVWAALAVAALSVSCAQLKKGRCDHDADCSVGFVCNIYRECVRNSPRDAGDAGDAHRDGAREAATDANDAHPDAHADRQAPCTVDANMCGPSTPFCNVDAGTCRGCETDAECAKRDPTKPACLIAGDGAGTCVACMGDKHCGSDAPVCNRGTNTCGGCWMDSQCQRFAPGICKTFLPTEADAAVSGGACVKDTETIYVQNATGCLKTTTTADAGTDAGAMANVPFCSMEPVQYAISKNRFVVVVKGGVGAGTWTYADQAMGNLLIVGQQSAVIGSSGTPAFSMSSGNVTIRNVSFTSNLSMGIQATGGMITLDRVVVDSCKEGGILLNGAAFDIENSLVKNDGPAQTGPVSWAGIYVAALPPAGKPKLLHQVTLVNDSPVAVACFDKIDGVGVAVTAQPGNVAVQNSCMFGPCVPADAGTTCGMQP